jgi:hypothetical protein
MDQLPIHEVDEAPVDLNDPIENVDFEDQEVAAVPSIVVNDRELDMLRYQLDGEAQIYDPMEAQLPRQA